MSVYKKLNVAREKFHQLKLTKTGENKFAGYKYFELGDFLIPALGVFREVGLCAYVSFDKERATMTIVDLETDTKMEIHSPMGSANLKGCHEVQNIGAVETYQRRYLWVAALEIVEHDALDATTGKDTPRGRGVNSNPQGPEDGSGRLPQPARVPGVAPSFRSSATMGVLETLSPDRQAVVRRAAEAVIERYEADDVVGAWGEYDGFADDERVALRGLLPSKVKTALTKHAETLKEPA